jgi:hypothetical protein
MINYAQTSSFGQTRDPDIVVAPVSDGFPLNGAAHFYYYSIIREGATQKVYKY